MSAINFNLSVNNSSYIEDENGNRRFSISGFAINTQSGENRFRQIYVNSTGFVEIKFLTNNGSVTKIGKPSMRNSWSRPSKHSSSRALPVSFDLIVEGNDILPDDIMKVKLVVKFDNTVASNEVVIQKKLISNISEETLLKRELEKQRIKNQVVTMPKIIPEIIPEIIPVVVASSALIPLGIIAFLLINSRKGKK